MAKIEIGWHNIDENHSIARDVWEMILDCDTQDFTAPGQFVNIQVQDCYLRRPLSVALAEEGKLTLVYKVVGKGTEILSRQKSGAALNLMYPLGNGFDTSKCSREDDIVLIGGGAGVPPLYGLAKKLISQGKRPQVILGFAGKEDVFYREKFLALGCEVDLSTLDGSLGVKGTVLDAAAGRLWDMIYTCGPEPMLHGVKDLAASGEFSFESRMGCGFGFCMGCSCETKYGNKRICADGPVLDKEEILW